MKMSAKAAWKSTKIGKKEKKKSFLRIGPEPMKKKNRRTSPTKVGQTI